jgi:hypothetical protein
MRPFFIILMLVKDREKTSQVYETCEVFLWRSLDEGFPVHFRVLSRRTAKAIAFLLNNGVIQFFIERFWLLNGLSRF